MRESILAAVLGWASIMLPSQGTWAEKQEIGSLKDKIALVQYLNNNSVERPTVKSAESSRELLLNIHFRVYAAVKEICEEEGIAAKNCTWSARVEREPSFQAYAYRANEIVVHSGLIDKTTYEEEVAFVVAHEIAHHILRHLPQKRSSILVGAILGSVSGVGPNAGAAFGAFLSQTQSTKMETAADAVSFRILESAGYDLRLARPILLRMAKLDGRSRTKFLASHPASLERLIFFDQLLSESKL